MAGERKNKSFEAGSSFFDPTLKTGLCLYLSFAFTLSCPSNSRGNRLQTPRGLRLEDSHPRNLTSVLSCHFFHDRDDVKARRQFYTATAIHVISHPFFPDVSHAVQSTSFAPNQSSYEMSTDVAELNKRKRDEPDEKPIVQNDDVVIQPKEEQCDPPTKRQKGDSDSDSDCISQEDLLAQLGLNSVKKLKAEEANANKVVHPEPPKQSIVEFLSCPVISKKVEPSSQPRKEKPLSNGYVEDEDLSDSENFDSKEKLIVKLQNNLRNEEAKLLLLRKLYACQNEKLPAKDTTPATTRATPATTASTTHAQPSAVAGQRKTTQAPTIQKQQTNVPSSNVQPRVVFLAQPRGQPVIIAPKLVPVSGKALQGTKKDATGRNIRPLQALGSQNGGPKTVLSVPTGSKVTQRLQSAQTTAVYIQNAVGNTANKSASQLGNTTARPSENGLLKSTSGAINILHSPSPPQQTQAEAKLALRKQLERTLLQIPLPKPPVQNWSFVPTVNTQDFTILIGLEGVVNHIVDSKEMDSNPDKKQEPELIPPKFCAQCSTDFTPGWRKQQLEGDTKVATLCETCCTQKIKKTLKSDHTTRLKAAFVKALKQEQEVEQKYQGSGGAVTKIKTDVATKGQQSARASSHHQVPALQARVVYHPQPVHHSLQPQVYQSHHSIVHQLQQQQQLQQQHQELEGTHRQEPRYFTYVGSHHPPQHKQRHGYSGGDHDRQREYLLDMIPSGHNSRGYRI